MSWPRSPISSGVLLAVLAALSFGATLPLVQHAGRGTGPFTTAALLYAGACLSTLVPRRAASGGGPLERRDFARLLAVALFGAAAAPTLLAWGLQRAGATAGALLLNLEAFFTVLLARALYGEALGGRMLWALGSMALGGVALVLDQRAGSAWSALGALAVLGATLGWALDNALTRPLAERDPVLIVGVKALLGVALTSALAACIGEVLPGPASAATLLACGATGYGLSLRLYILAQRRMGAARTGSVFALAPFVGAAVAWLAGDRGAGLGTALGAMFFALGVFLHATERHTHWHWHPALEHEHLHQHGDGHHDHRHDPPFAGEHSHPHYHDALGHEHEHADDVHHGHRHA